MVEKTAETECRDGVACTAIDGRYRMAAGLTGRRNTMARIAPVAHDVRAGVVREGTLKTRRRMTDAAFGIGTRVRWGGRFAYGYPAVVATRARSGNARMIKAAVQFQL